MKTLWFWQGNTDHYANSGRLNYKSFHQNLNRLFDLHYYLHGSKDPSKLFLCLKIQKLWLKLSLDGQWTKFGVLFSIRMWFSSFMIIFQLG